MSRQDETPPDRSPGVTRRWWLALSPLLLLAVGATGLHAVAPGEVAVVRRLGRLLDSPWGPGLHLGLPAGLDVVDRVRPDEVKRLALGLPEAPERSDDPGAGEYLTGDRNLILVRAIVQYRVRDPAAYVLRAAEAEPVLTRLAEAALARALAGRKVDAVMRDERAAVHQAIASDVSRGVEGYDLGLAILGVSLTSGRPPVEVEADFAAAQSARSLRDRRLNEARATSSTLLTAARAEARTRLDRALATASRRLALAKAGAERFLALLDASRENRDGTLRRLYLDTLRELLPRVRRKLVLSTDDTIDLSILGPVRPEGSGAPPPGPSR